MSADAKRARRPPLYEIGLLLFFEKIPVFNQEPIWGKIVEKLKKQAYLPAFYGV